MPITYLNLAESTAGHSRARGGAARHCPQLVPAGPAAARDTLWPPAQGRVRVGLTRSAAPRWGAWLPAAPWRGTGTYGWSGWSGPGAAWTTEPGRSGVGSAPWYLPLGKLRRPHLLPGGVHVAHHEVLGDLLHVLEVEEGVEAQLVCKDTRRSCGSAKGWGGLRA